MSFSVLATWHAPSHQNLQSGLLITTGRFTIILSSLTTNKALIWILDIEIVSQVLVQTREVPLPLLWFTLVIPLPLCGVNL